MRNEKQEHFFSYQPKEVLDLQGYIDSICGDGLARRCSGENADEVVDLLDSENDDSGDCVDSDPHKKCTGTSMTKYVFINESPSPDFINFAIITASIPKETEKTGVSCVTDLQSKITFMGSSYKLSAIFLGGMTWHFVDIIPDEDEDGDLNIFYDGMGEPNNGGEWKPYVQTVKRRQKINTIRKCKDCDVGTVFYTKEMEEQLKKSNDDVAKIIHRLDSLIKPETIPSIEHIRKKHSWLFKKTTTDAEIKNDNDDAAAHNSLNNENSSNKSNDVPTAANTLATDKSTKKTAFTLAASKSTEEETDKVITKAIS